MALSCIISTNDRIKSFCSSRSLMLIWSLKCTRYALTWCTSNEWNMRGFQIRLQLMAVVGNQLVILVDAPHPVVVIINHLWNFYHPCKPVTPNSVEVCFVDCINSRLLPDTGNSLIRCGHCCDHCDNVVVHPSLDLEVVLIVDPIQGVEVLIEDIFVFFWWPTSPGSCSTTDGNIHCPCSRKNLGQSEKVVHHCNILS